jgi:hypothetical protein
MTSGKKMGVVELMLGFAWTYSGFYYVQPYTAEESGFLMYVVALTTPKITEYLCRQISMFTFSLNRTLWFP